jgi:hypothetical protein
MSMSGDSNISKSPAKRIATARILCVFIGFPFAFL